MRTITTFMLLALVFTGPFGRCAGASIAVKQTPPTREGILSLADTYIKTFTPKLALEDKTNVNNLKFNIESAKTVPSIQQRTIAETINALTMALSGSRSIEAVVVSSALLIKYAPTNARATNLFGTVLHSIGRFRDAVPVLEYTRTLDRQSVLVMLNLANAYLDVGADAKAKTLLYKVLAKDGKNRAAYKALAAYWFKVGDQRKAFDAMMKAAEGGMVQGISQENKKKVDQNRVTGQDPTTVMEAKLNAVKDLVPKTTADVVEDQFPDAARQIRDKYCRLLDNEKMIMPPLPQVNTSGLKNWYEKGAPYMNVWAGAFSGHMAQAMQEVAQMQTGINPSDSNAVKKAKGKAAAQKEMQKSLANAEQMLRQMQNTPGISKQQVAQARKQLEKAKKQFGMPASTASAAAGQNVIKSDADIAKLDAGSVPPGFDYGSIFAYTNYRDYLAIRNGYELYFVKYFREYNENVGDITRVYNRNLQKEDEYHEQVLHGLNMEEEREVKRIREAGTDEALTLSSQMSEEELRQFALAGHITTTMDKIAVDRWTEILRHKKKVNAIGESSFAQLINVAMPQYVQKMKPMLDNYWATCALYIRNMNQPEVMKREYLHCKQVFWQYGGQAVAAAGGAGGPACLYMGETYEEEEEFQRAVEATEAEAEARKEEYKQETKQMDDSAFVKWLEDNFALGVAGEFLSLKITPRQLTVEEYIAGMNFKHVYDFKNQTWTTYCSFAAKIDVGVQVGFLKAKVEGRVDLLESYDTLDCRTGKVVDGGSSFAKGTAGASISDGYTTVGKGVEVTLDPALESELSMKTTRSMGVKAGAGPFELGGDVPL